MGNVNRQKNVFKNGEIRLKMRNILTSGIGKIRIKKAAWRCGFLKCGDVRHDPESEEK
jgi:hypothetical protein